MKIAVVGTRGVPASFGGIEKHCENLYSLIVKYGHEVTVYARKGYIDKDIKEFNGIKIIQLPTIPSKHLEATVHTFLALLHASFTDVDIIHFHAQGPCVFSWIPKLISPNKKLIFTCHGIDWKRNKWSKFAQLIIRMGEYLSAKNFDSQIMVSKALEEYYNNTYKINGITIPNGTSPQNTVEANEIKSLFDLNKGDYILSIGRIVPEKAPHKLIEVFKTIKTDKKLVIAGGSASTDKYFAYLKELAGTDKRIIFTSYIYGQLLNEIYSNALLYVSTSELEGMPLTLLEAMSYGLPCLVSDIPPHKEIILDEKLGWLFQEDSATDLKEKLEYILSSKEEDLSKVGSFAQKYITQTYSWEKAAMKHKCVYEFTKHRYVTNINKTYSIQKSLDTPLFLFNK